MAEAQPAILLDKSRAYATVHGDRTPDDPHYRVTYEQDGLPFDAHGKLVPDDGNRQSRTVIMEGEKGPISVTFRPLYSDKMREIAAKKLNRLLRAAQQLPQEPDEEEPIPEATDVAEDVNLEAWLRGEVNYPPFKLFKVARDRYKKQHQKIRSLVEDLVYDEKLVPESEVAPRLMKLLDQAA